MKTSIAFVRLLLLLASAVCKADHHEESLQSSLNPPIYGDNPDDAVLSQTQDQKTVICPVVAQDLYANFVQYGPRTRFIIKNTSTDPVVVTYVHRNGTEYSAADAEFRPANMDPDAMLAPGVTKVFAVHEGHVFHVRDKMTGELLMQHRVGLVPIENKFNREIAFCPNTAPNETTNTDKDFRVMRKFPQWKPSLMEKIDQDIDLHVGYKNYVKSQSGAPCPINMFFVYREDSGRRRPPQFFERFSLQLGSNDMATYYEDEASSTTKYERTYLGHEFVARLAHDDSVVVDHVTVEPIRVQDCSPKKKISIKTPSLANAVVIPVGRHQTIGEEDAANQTRWEAVLHQLNTTESRRGLYFKMYTE